MLQTGVVHKGASNILGVRPKPNGYRWAHRACLAYTIVSLVVQ